MPVSSVHALPYTPDLAYTSSGNEEDATHGGLHQSPGVYSATSASVVSNVSRQSLTASSLTGAGSVRSATAVGSLSHGEVQTRTIALDQGPAIISLLYQAGDLAMTLVSPSGRRIDPAVAAADADMGFSDGAILGGRQAAYSLLNPELGDWTVEIRAVAGEASGAPVGYAVNAWFEAPAVTLEGSFAQPSIATGEDLVLMATVRELGAPVHGASVRARIAFPDDSFADITLRDDGSNGDITAGDGTYSTTHPAASQPGLYRVISVAEGSTSAGHPFSREVFGLASVSEGSSRLTAFRDHGFDSNGNTFYDELVVEVDLNTDAAGHYQVLAVLADSEGNTHEAKASVNLVAGDNTIPLIFDGQPFYGNRVDGPYTLTSIRLAQEGELDLLPTRELDNAHVTEGYAYNDFEHERIQLTGTGLAVGSDTDGNGLYDLLDVALEVELAQSGYYQWSARLTDRTGTEIGFFAGASYMPAGRGEFLLSFGGEAIGRNGEDGPYFVTGLLAFGGGANLVAERVFQAEPFLASQFEGYVRDRTPPVLTLSANPSLLWPPNHRMVPVEVKVDVHDDIDPQPVVTLLSVVSSEPDNGVGDGDTVDDIQDAESGTDDRELKLRAERSGEGNGRIYTLTYQARDAAGNTTIEEVIVTVPRNRRH